MTLPIGLFLIAILGLFFVSASIFKQQNLVMAQQYVQTIKYRNLVMVSAPWATNDIRPPAAYSAGAIAAVEITNIPNSVIAKVVILVVIISYLTEGSIKGALDYDSNQGKDRLKLLKTQQRLVGITDA